MPSTPFTSAPLLNFYQNKDCVDVTAAIGMQSAKIDRFGRSAAEMKNPPPGDWRRIFYIGRMTRGGVIGKRLFFMVDSHYFQAVSVFVFVQHLLWPFLHNLTSIAGCRHWKT